MKPKTKTLLLIAAAFVLGIIAGGIGHRMWWSTQRSGHDRMSPAEFRDRFHSALALDSTQILSVDSLLEVYRLRLDSQRGMMQQFRDTLRTGIRSLLTDDQKKKYEEYTRAMESRMGGGRRDTTR